MRALVNLFLECEQSAYFLKREKIPKATHCDDFSTREERIFRSLLFLIKNKGDEEEMRKEHIHSTALNIHKMPDEDLFNAKRIFFSSAYTHSSQIYLFQFWTCSFLLYFDVCASASLGGSIFWLKLYEAMTRTTQTGDNNNNNSISIKFLAMRRYKPNILPQRAASPFFSLTSVGLGVCIDKYK